MPLDASIDELDSLLHTNTIREKIIAVNGKPDIDKILNGIRDLASKLD